MRRWSAAVLLSVLSVLVCPAYAAQWQHLRHLMGGPGCAARLPGKDVDTLIALNNNGQVLLLAGRPKWRIFDSRGIDVGLRIDDSAVHHLEGFAAGSIILVLARKPIVDQLKHAHDIHWTFPFGKFHAVISGFGPALTWLRKCEKDGQSAPVGKPAAFRSADPDSAQ